MGLNSDSALFGDPSAGSFNDPSDSAAVGLAGTGEEVGSGSGSGGPAYDRKYMEDILQERRNSADRKEKAIRAEAEEAWERSRAMEVSNISVT